MKKYLFFILVFGFLFFSLPVFATGYTRTPAGFTIYNPVEFRLFGDSYEDMKNGFCQSTDFTKWRVIVRTMEDAPISSEEVESSVLDYTFSFTLPLGNYLRVSYYCLVGEDYWIWQDLENYFGPPIFEVVEAPAPPPAGYFSFDFATNTLAYVGGLFTDLSTPIYILIGITLGMWLIDYLLGLFAQKRKQK
jgi:hypothetical protein